MTEFKLCEEMGLVRLLDTNVNEPVIKASDVEKMLQGGQRIQANVDYTWNEIKDSAGLFYMQPKTKGETTETISLTIPQKHKPVTKEDVLQALKTLNILHNKFDHVTDLIERIEKAGIE